MTCPDTPAPNTGYFTVSPPTSPHTTTLYWGPQRCCCAEDGNVLDLLLAFILARKTNNPQIFKARKVSSPNGSCEAVEVQWEFGNGQPSGQTLLDIPEILLYYLAIMAAI